VLALGGLRLSSPLVLAPMESVSDAAFRHLCWESGAALTFTEMVRARGVVRNNAATLALIDTLDPEVPTGVQLLVTSEAELLAALEKIETLALTTHPHFKNLRAVDLNLGCPSPEVIKIGAGPALLKRTRKLEAIFGALARWKATTALPIDAVGAKIRLGLNRPEQDQKVYLRAAEVADAHLDYLVVHARHARQASDAPPTWAAIAEVKARARIPIVGNGDVRSREDLERLVRETGADGAMIARAAIRSPLVFRALRGLGPGTPATTQEVDELERRYLALAARFGTRPKFLAWHREGFGRMRARLAAGALAEADPSPAPPMG
jgi:tRNA-dihydrouridine synthase B